MKKWIAAARLRTLPLAFSCIILGTFIAAFFGHFNSWILLLCLLTTLLYQVLSNYANDYGDGVKGTDQNRKGEARAVASGTITAKQMKNAVTLVAVLAFLSGTTLSIVATLGLPVYVTLAFILLGILAIWAAIKYTVGNSAYGYRGLGDIYVLVFFGWVGVLGSYFLQAHTLNFWVFLPATAIGFLAAGVLNLNNMRDRTDDFESGKITLAVKLGPQKSKHYQAFLMIGAVVITLVFVLKFTHHFWSFLFLLTIPLLGMVLIKSYRAKQPQEFDQLLKPLALTTLLFSLLLGLGLILTL